MWRNNNHNNAKIATRAVLQPEGNLFFTAGEGNSDKFRSIHAVFILNNNSSSIITILSNKTHITTIINSSSNILG
jgi:hypothetical protein